MSWYVLPVILVIALLFIPAILWNKEDNKRDSSEHLPLISEEGNSGMGREEELMGQIGRGEF